MWGTQSILEVGKRHGGTVLLLMVLTLSLVVNVNLGWRLKAAYLRVPNESPITSVGRQVRDVDVRSIAGVPSRLTFAGTPPTVLYFLSPTCSWCEQNYANIVALASNRSDYRFIGLVRSRDTQAVSDYLAKQPLPFPVFLIDNDEWIQLVAVAGTPATLLIAADGKVSQFWRGAYSKGRRDEIERFFGVKLPGLSSERVALAGVE